VDPEIICLHLKKEAVNASKIYSLVGNLAEQAKQLVAAEHCQEAQYMMETAENI